MAVHEQVLEQHYMYMYVWAYHKGIEIYTNMKLLFFSNIIL